MRVLHSASFYACIMDLAVDEKYCERHREFSCQGGGSLGQKSGLNAMKPESWR